MAKKRVDFMKTGIIEEAGFFGGKQTEEKPKAKKPVKKTGKTKK